MGPLLAQGLLGGGGWVEAFTAGMSLPAFVSMDPMRQGWDPRHLWVPLL